MVDLLPAAAVREFGHLDALQEPAFVLTADGKVQFANEASRRICDTSSSGRQVVLTDLLPAEDRPGFREVLGQTAAGHSWTGRLQLTWRDQRLRACDVTCMPVRRDTDPALVLCVVGQSDGERGREAEARRPEERLAKLGRVTTNLAGSDDLESVRDVVVLDAADALGATVGSLSLLDGPDTLALIGLRGGNEDAATRWARFAVDDSTPAGTVIRTGGMLLLVGREQIDAQFPHLERATEGERSMVALPLTVTGETIGVITWSFPGRRRFDAAELEFLAIVADTCAQTIERIRAREHSAEQRARLSFLADVTSELATSLDYERTLANVAKMAVPRFADWCAIDALEDGRLHRLAVEHVDPTKIRMAMELEERYPADPESGGTWDVIRSGESLFLPEIPDEMIDEGARDAAHAELLRHLQLRSIIVAPLVARGRALGALTWVMAESERRYLQADIPFLEDLARRAAVAIDNAQLHSQTLEAAVRLQRAVLPDLPAKIAGWEVAAHYTPAGRTEVGGDFYDVIELPSGDVAFFLGDVMGRGVGAAAAMAQMRAAMRAYIAIDPEPEVVFDKLNRLFATYQLSQLVTLVYAVLERDGGQITLVNAGHPPPLLIHRDGSTTSVGATPGPPLGAGIGGHEPTRVPMEPGEVILAFTDGLIERREEDIDVGLARAAAAAHRLLEDGLGAALGVVVDEVRDHSRDDDVAALALRRPVG